MPKKTRRSKRSKSKGGKKRFFTSTLSWIKDNQILSGLGGALLTVCIGLLINRPSEKVDASKVDVGRDANIQNSNISGRDMFINNSSDNIQKRKKALEYMKEVTIAPDSFHRSPQSFNAGRDIVMNSKDNSELIAMFERHAKTINKDLHSTYLYVDVTKFLLEFNELHEAHIEALRRNHEMLAIEIFREIQRKALQLEFEEGEAREKKDSVNGIRSIEYLLGPPVYNVIFGRATTVYVSGEAQNRITLKQHWLNSDFPEAKIADFYDEVFSIGKDNEEEQKNPQVIAEINVAGRDIVYNTKDQKELIQLLNLRAEKIHRDLNKYYYHSELQFYIPRFDHLHRKHIEALENNNFVLAHEIVREIHSLSFELDSNEEKQQQKKIFGQIMRQYLIELKETDIAGALAAIYFKDAKLNPYDSTFYPGGVIYLEKITYPLPFKAENDNFPHLYNSILEGL